MGVVLWTVFSTREYPPSDSDMATIRARRFDWTLGLGGIFALVLRLPRRMRELGLVQSFVMFAKWVYHLPDRLPRRMWELGLVQFFTWIGMFAMWVYFPPAVARNIFHAAPGSVEMEASGSWSGFCFAAYNAVCFFFSFVLLWGTKYTGPRLMHILCLAVGALGLATVPLTSDKYHLLISMTAIGIAWASILSMPYAMLAPSLPKEKVGVMMGMFNLFIVAPQIAASSLLGWILKNYLHSEPMNALVLGGVSMGLAALLTLLVVTFKQAGGESDARGLAGTH
jgi:maltose/moltooligosaccharide transporter